jgi:hypothetical protein
MAGLAAQIPAAPHGRGAHLPAGHPAPGKVIPALKKDLNSFLLTWLTNAIQQGHSFTNLEGAA